MPKNRRRSKGHIPMGMTGGIPYNVTCKVCKDTISTDTSVEEQLLQTEARGNKIASMTSMEEQEVQIEVCETEATESSPKKRRRKRDKVASSSK
jgi:hypothetical protein